MFIIKTKSSEPTAVPQLEIRYVSGRKATEQSSLLDRVAVVFYALGLTLGFADNNCYRVLPDVKGDPHVLCFDVFVTKNPVNQFHLLLLFPLVELHEFFPPPFGLRRRTFLLAGLIFGFGMFMPCLQRFALLRH